MVGSKAASVFCQRPNVPVTQTGCLTMSESELEIKLFSKTYSRFCFQLIIVGSKCRLSAVIWFTSQLEEQFRNYRSRTCSHLFIMWLKSYKETLYKNGFKGYFCSRPWIKLGGLHFDCICRFLSNPKWRYAEPKPWRPPHWPHVSVSVSGQWPAGVDWVPEQDVISSCRESQFCLFFSTCSFLNLSFRSHLFIFNVVSAVHHQHSTNIDIKDDLNGLLIAGIYLENESSLVIVFN